MPNRFQRHQYQLAWDFVAARDGEYCLICKVSGKKARLQIDHKDNDITNFRPENLNIICQKHNLEMRSLTLKDKAKLLDYHSAMNVCARARGNSATNVIKSVVDYNQGTPEMQVNSLVEVQWREWLFQEIGRTGFILKDDAVYSGAELYGCSPSTAERYLKKVTSVRGALFIERDGLGNKVVKFKPGK